MRGDGLGRTRVEKGENLPVNVSVVRNNVRSVICASPVPTQFASKTGVGTIGLFLCSHVPQ